MPDFHLQYFEDTRNENVTMLQTEPSSICPKAKTMSLQVSLFRSSQTITTGRTRLDLPSWWFPTLLWRNHKQTASFRPHSSTPPPTTSSPPKQISAPSFFLLTWSRSQGISNHVGRRAQRPALSAPPGLPKEARLFPQRLPERSRGSECGVAMGR